MIPIGAKPLKGKQSGKSQETKPPQQIPDELRKVLENPDLLRKNPELLELVRGIIVQQSSTFVGPLPPPEILEGYNKVLPGGAERIVAMAEAQSQHRRQMEAQIISEELKQSRRGQIFGFVLALVGLGLSTLLAILGHTIVASIIGGSTIIGLAVVFVVGKKRQEKNPPIAER